MKKIVCVLSLLFACSSLLAATFVVPSDRDMIRRSHAIVVGESLGSYTRLNEFGGIETVTTFSITEKVMGAPVMSTVDIVEPGGVYGNKGQSIAGVPRFQDGEKDILFLRRIPKGWAVTDIALGRFGMTSDVMGNKLAIREESDVVGWNPDGSIHKEPRRDAAKFLEFLRTEARGGRGREDYFVDSYPLTVKAYAPVTIGPNLSSAGKTGKSYTSAGDNPATAAGTGARWFNMPTAHQWYLVTITTATGESAGSSTVLSNAPSNGLTAVTTAMTAWTNEANSNVNYVFNAGAAPCGSNCTGLHGGDSTNEISFETDLTTFGIANFGNPTPCAGVVGIGGPSYSLSTATGPDGDPFYQITEGDVEFNRGVNACMSFVTGGDLNSGMTHEVGHTLGFRHSDQLRTNDPASICSTDSSLECSTTAIMKAVLPPGKNGVLQSYDLNAVQSVYPCSFGGGCGVIKADFNADGKSDVIWRKSTTGENAMWLMNGVTITSPVLLSTVADTNWKMAGVGDFNGDGKADVIWHHALTGQVAIWLMNGTSLSSAAVVTTVGDTNFKIAGVGDVDGDGKADVIWRNQSTGQVIVWIMNGTTINSGAILSTVADTNYNIVGIGDFNGDGKADLLWRNGATGVNVVWLLNGTSISSAAVTNTVSDLNYKVVGVGDVNSDGKADVAWWNQSTGDVVFWTMNGATVTSGAFITQVSDTNWHVEAVGDFDGDGKSDLVWRKVNTGDTVVWLMNGTTLKQATFATTVSDLNWSIVAPK